jgi:hypothetical protein
MPDDVKLSLALNLISADPERATPQGTMAAAYVEATRDREALQERYSYQYRELGAAQHEIERLREQLSKANREAHGWAARGDEHLCKRCKEGK